MVDDLVLVPPVRARRHGRHLGRRRADDAVLRDPRHDVRRSRADGRARRGHRVDRDRVFIPASLLAFVSGVLLVIESDFYGFGDDWIVIGLGALRDDVPRRDPLPRARVRPYRKADRRGLARGGPRMRRLLLLSRLDLVLLFAMIYDMTVKPDFGDAASILWGSRARWSRPGSSTGATGSRSRRASPPGPRSSLLLSELDEQRPPATRSPGRRAPLHRALERRVHRDLHLHRLEDDERLAGRTVSPGLDLDSDHRARHRRRDRALAVAPPRAMRLDVDVRRRCGRRGGRLSRHGARPAGARTSGCGRAAGAP